MPKRKKKSRKESSSFTKLNTDVKQVDENLNFSVNKKEKQIFNQNNIGTIPEEEKRSIQKISEELREKNLGYYDFKNMTCRIHNIPLNKYRTQESQNGEPYPIHCHKCIPIPESWIKVN